MWPRVLALHSWGRRYLYDNAVGSFGFLESYVNRKEVGRDLAADCIDSL